MGILGPLDIFFKCQQIVKLFVVNLQKSSFISEVDPGTDVDSGSEMVPAFQPKDTKKLKITFRGKFGREKAGEEEEVGSSWGRRGGSEFVIQAFRLLHQAESRPLMDSP